MTLLEVKNLHVAVDGNEILKGVDLAIEAGEVHAVMGPNGAGKSTLSHVLAGREGYQVSEGEVLFKGKNILEMAPEERAGEGLFLAMQYPVEIPGVPNSSFLKEAVNAIRKYRGEDQLDAMAFMKSVREKAKLLGVDAEFLKRPVNVGFSGGEKKRNEMLQMAVLDPVFAILDETDSGLDIDALKTVAEGVNAMRDPKRGMLIITHYQRLLDHIIPDRVHVLSHGRIAESGDAELARKLEAEGYAAYQKTEAA